jgi:transposase
MRSAELGEAAWARIEALIPQAEGRSRPWRDHRQVVEGIVFRYRTGGAWRDLPERIGPWQTVWKRHHRFATDGTWDMLLRVIQSEADAAGRVDWSVSVDSSIGRAHQHSATAKRVVRGDRARLEEHIGARLNDRKSRCCRDEPGDHALGRSRGGLRTKIHAAVEGACITPRVVPHHLRPKRRNLRKGRHEMRVLLSTYGSRGDVEPMEGLAVQLGALGAEVRVCAPRDFAELLAGVGVPLVPTGQPVRPPVTGGDAAVGGGPAPARGRVSRRPVRHRRRGGRGM